MAMAEIEVFGAGIFGLTVAYCLQKRGAKVRVIEKRRVGAGASGGVVGALAPHSPDNWNDKKQFQFESLIATKAFWAEVDGISGIASGYGQTGRLVALLDQRELDLARERVASAKTVWQGHAEWRVVPSGWTQNWGPDSPTGFFSFDTLSARISPRAACASLAAAFLRNGGEILEGQTVGQGADAAVLCTGYEGLLEMSAGPDGPVGKGIKGQGLLVDFVASDLPQIYAAGLHFIPHADGTLAIGSTSEKAWDDSSGTDANLEALYRRAIAEFPQLSTAKVLNRWAGVRPCGSRRAPVLGRHPRLENTFVANGGFKIGFGVVVKAGQVMADLVLSGQASIPKGFSVEANFG
ncbi:MAG: FAD-dependent oxidoreductase [Rhodobacterales bacterium]|nr:FAD-dependent oxidoreductase [Pseudomonadota bacterium]MDA1285922.1 FAD-dependent oxidoreductase [Pseudomonadota bacterium]